MIRFVAVTTLLLLSAIGSQAARPNIVFILADDLGVHDLACYGRKDHRTPNLDALSDRGLRFTSAYAACPVCSPTRAALMTGKHPAGLHLTTFLPGRPDAASQMLLQPKIVDGLPSAETTIAHDLKSAGYATGCFGKWHLGGKGKQPKDFGFDLAYAGKADTKPTETEGGKGEYDLTDAAIRFVEANRTKPFFVYLAHNNPHIPYAAYPERVKANAGAFEPTYAAVIETLDDAVGRLVKSLEGLKLIESTWVIFTSDNGGLHVPELSHDRITHNGPYRAGKGFLYEGGIRVPAIVAGPGMNAGVSDTPILTSDWRPTLRTIAGMTNEESKETRLTDGVDLTKLFTGMELKTDRPLWWHLPHYTNQGSRPSGALRDGQWKLIEHYATGRAELFDLENDLGERSDRAEADPERVKRMRATLEALRTAHKVQRNTPNPKFDPTEGKAVYGGLDPSVYDPRIRKFDELVKAWRRRMNAAILP